MGIQTIGLSVRDLDNILAVSAAVLRLGNIEFQGSVDDSKIHPNTMSDLTLASTLLGVPQDILLKVFTSRKIKTMHDSFTRPLGREEAGVARDSLAKALYEKLFKFVTSAANESIGCPSI